MRGRLAEVAAVFALATVVTAVMAAPVLRAPSERLFGMEIVGRHHDPFTVIAQFSRPITLGVYSQPLTDITGAVLARMLGAIAAYNWLVLLSFPLSAAAAYLLARHLALSRTGATFAALMFAFSPFHLAQASYHPHIAQTEWLPLYFLALWRCLERSSPAAMVLLVAAAMAVTLSNFYAGLIAAVITPLAVAVYWVLTYRNTDRPWHHLAVTLGGLSLVVGCGMAYVHYAAPSIVTETSAFAFPRGDLFRYSARWWSYLIPPVEHPLLGTASYRLWASAGVREGLLEQQVTLGWGIVVLGVLAISRWLARDRQLPSLVCVPLLAIVGAAAFACSLSPESSLGGFVFVRPSSLLYDVVPMFRAYARFGVVVQLMAAVLAGIGLDWLRRSGTTWGQMIGIALACLAVAEYSVSPATLWRDVLPTTAHRWVARQPQNFHVLDCAGRGQEGSSVPWLTGNRVALLGGAIDDCADANLGARLAENGYTHVLVRRNSAAGRWLAVHPTPDGLRLAAGFEDGQVFTVGPERPPIYSAPRVGFFSRERDLEWTWRWMGSNAAWTVRNTTGATVVATLALEAAAFHRARRMELLLDGQLMRTLVVEPTRGILQIGPLMITAGEHQLDFHATEAATIARDTMHNGDPRGLSIAVGTWNWSMREEQP